MLLRAGSLCSVRAGGRTPSSMGLCRAPRNLNRDTTIGDIHNSELGDVKVLGRYTGLAPQHNVGILFSFKLPTGATL